MDSGARGPVKSLYVHVPFCARKCPYCAFLSEVPTGDLVDRYVRALIRELELTAHELAPQTIYFGGGTPTLLNLQQWEQILRALERFLNLEAAEWTVECNPATLSREKARRLRSGGVNRVSLGVQSLDDDLLERLGRVHSRARALQSFDLLRQAGFDNINLDLMFAIPGQTMAVWRETLEAALALGSEHLSCYEVTYEEDTPLYEQLRAHAFEVDEDLACAMYEELLEAAARHGFQQYEVANFARPEINDPRAVPRRACQHNVNYWRGGSFFGLGPGASSFVGGVRTTNWADPRRYCEHLERGEHAIESRDELTPLERAGEIAAFGLRMTLGWPFARFQQVTGYDLRTEWGQEMTRLVERGWGELEDDGFRLTRQGLRFADAAAELFLRSP